MSDFTLAAFPPRLTPSPPPFVNEMEGDPNRRPTPPLRKSIYPHPCNSNWYVNIVPYNPDWPGEFRVMSNQLLNIFASADPPAQCQSIEHIGSTSIPGLAAKPNIDILVTFDCQSDLDVAIEALNWEIPKVPPFAKYTQIPRGGGIPGRESYKIYLPEDHPYYAVTPERSVYLIADIEENPAGRLQIRCYRTVRDVLRSEENSDLLKEYAEVKLKLAREAFPDALQYSARKDDVIRKVLLRGGWTEAEVDKKEKLTRREWIVDAEAAY